MASTKKIVIFLKEKAAETYERQIAEDAVNPSAFFTRLIMDREKETVAKRPVGRQPKKIETEAEKEARWEREKNEPKTIPHPDQRIDYRTGLPPPPMNRYELEIWSNEVDLFGPAEHKLLPGYMPKEERTG